jgi:hypothetical protein
MLPIYLVLAVVLAAPSWVGAQEAVPDGPAPQAEAPSDAGVRHAIPRGSRPQTDNPRVSTSAPRGDRPVLRPSVAPPAADPQNAVTQVEAAPEPVRQAVPRGSRPQGDNPRTGTAVPREAPPPPSSVGGGNRVENRGRVVVVPDRRRSVVVRPPAVYNNYYYYPRRYYPYGYGSFGLGYFYYDPFDPYRWQSPYPTYGYGSGYYGRPYSTFDIGELRLDVSPRHAQVYVDGYYAGVVDDYDGAFQAIKLESGAYRIDIMAPGYETLTFDVRINPGQKIRYRGDLIRRP